MAYKNEGVTRVVGTETWNWYPRHIMEGRYDGMYVKKSASKHNKLLEYKEKFKRPQTAVSFDTPPTALITQKLTLNNSLNIVMVVKS